MSSRPSLANLPAQVQVRVEVHRGSLVKRGPHGSIDFLSPIPCPFDYGSVLGHEGLDGDPADAVLLGGPRARDSVHTLPVLGRVCFLDAGLLDDKWICGPQPPSEADRRALAAFFRTYAAAKAALGPLRALRSGQRGRTAYEGLEWR